MKKYFAEFIGTYFLLSTVVGSGIMAERLSMGNDAIALLANAIATGATLIVFISIFINISGAHFNPVVSIIMYLRNKIKFNQTIFFIIVQIFGGILGVWTIHFIFELEILQLSSNIRTGIPQYSSEILATFGLIFVILMSEKYNPDKIPILVGLYITSAYWFTSSTSFANPAVTIARTLSDTFSGINYGDTFPFIFCQFVGGLLALFLFKIISSNKI